MLPPTIAEPLGKLVQTIPVNAFVGTGLSIVFIWLIRWSLYRIIRGKRQILSEEQRRWNATVKNISLAIFMLLMLYIWAPQLRNFALSITVVAVALVLAVKEVLLCLSGAFLRMVTKPFRVGDWITINNISGEVSDVGMFHFRIQETEADDDTYAFTGRTIQFPSSVFFTTTVFNGNFLRHYVFQDIKVVVPNTLDPEIMMAELKQATTEEFEKFRQEAEAYNDYIERRSSYDIADAEPEYFIGTHGDMGLLFLNARVFLPTTRAGEISSRVRMRVLKKSYKLQQE